MVSGICDILLYTVREQDKMGKATNGMTKKGNIYIYRQSHSLSILLSFFSNSRSSWTFDGGIHKTICAINE